MTEFISDRLRLVLSTHTTSRRLDVLTLLVKIIGTKQLPINFLQSQAETKSQAIQSNNSEYLKLKGRLLSNDNSPTTAFKHYVKLLEEFGLIITLGSNVSLTKLGHVLLILTEKRDYSIYELSLEERLFYTYLLFTKDADFILTTLDLLKEGENLNQRNIQTLFVGCFLQRLKAKIGVSNQHTKIQIGERIRKIEVEWSNPEKYSEHLAVPRLEWLEQLDLISVANQGGSTCYSITNYGKHILQCTIKIIGTEFRDVNEGWLSSSAFSCFGTMPYGDLQIINYMSLPERERESTLQPLIWETYNLFNTDSAMRISLVPALPYLCIRCISMAAVSVDIEDVKLYLSEPKTIRNLIFSYRPSSRSNEGYINAKISLS